MTKKRKNAYRPLGDAAGCKKAHEILETAFRKYGKTPILLKAAKAVGNSCKI